MSHIRLIQGCFFSFLVAIVLQSNGEVTSAWEPTIESKLPNKPVFTLDDIRKFRDHRYIRFMESLSETQLSEENQELIALSLSQAYSGVPVCSFDFALDSAGSEAFPSEEKARWRVLKSGGIERENKLARRHLRDAPFSFVPNNPFDLVHGKVVVERKSSVKFRFPLIPQFIAPNLDSDAVRVLRKLDWIAELTVDIKNKAPRRLLLTLDSEDSRAHSPLVSFDVARVEYLYQYNESCQYYEVYSKLRHFEGTSLFSGDFLDKTIKTFTNVRCDIPITYLLPEVKELEFIERF